MLIIGVYQLLLLFFLSSNLYHNLTWTQQVHKDNDNDKLNDDKNNNDETDNCNDSGGGCGVSVNVDGDDDDNDNDDNYVSSRTLWEAMLSL